MREYKFYQVDVFTDEPFTGNPLVVVPDAEGLSAQEMQMIAREFGFPESTFVLPPEKDDSLYRMRIFTGTVELPFTGHPAIGAHWVMAQLGRVDLIEPVTTISYEQAVGVLTADFHVKDGKVDHIMMDQCRPLFMSVLNDIRPLARGLGINPESITQAGLPVQVVSTGMPQLMVPVRSLSAVRRLDAAYMDIPSLTRALDAVGASFIVVFSTETDNPEADMHVRGFGHVVGIPEDPVTGSANGALGAYLVHHRVVPVTGSPVSLLGEQGSEMKRPGLLRVEVEHNDGVPTNVKVGGKVVQVIEGMIYL
jgi:trans-2,3-dihydro-3-hydroxyanthranilate isomerase